MKHLKQVNAFFKAKKSQIVAAGLATAAVVSTNASAVLDMSAVTDAVDGATVASMIGVAAGILILPQAARWAFRKLISFIR